MTTFTRRLAGPIAALAAALAGCAEEAADEITMPAWLTESRSGSAATPETGATPQAPDESIVAAPQPLPSYAGAAEPSTPLTTVDAAAPPPAAGGFAQPPAYAATAQPGSVPTGHPSAAGSPYYEPPVATGPAAGPAPFSAAPAPNGSPAMSVRQGDRVPLRRTVDTSLSQSRPDGSADVHRTRTAVDMTLTAAESSQVRVRWNVRFDAVRVSRNFDGREFEFRTGELLQASADPEVAVYEAMVGRGFGFTLDASNRLVGLEGFEAFVADCLGEVLAGGQPSAEPRQAVAEFVSSAVGLVEFEDLDVGRTFAAAHSVATPSPVRWTEEFRVDDVTPTTIRVSGGGRVSETASAAGEVSVRVVGGDVRSTAEVFRDSGLPQSAERTETLHMLVTTREGAAFPQTKVTTERVEAFPRTPL